MSEKDRKPGQNGKGSDTRVSDTKAYSDNYSQIDWTNKKGFIKKVNSFDSSRFLKVGDKIFNIHTGKIASVYKIDDTLGDVTLKFNELLLGAIRYSRSEIDDNWAYYANE